MFEKEIQFITDFNLNKLETISAPFTLEKLLEADIHPALIKYVSGRLDYMIYIERKTLLENSRFDYSGAKIAEYFNLIADEIKKTIKLSYEEMRTYLEKGVVFNANFSVKPKSTLLNLIYKIPEESKEAGEIRIYLNYIYYYNYLREIINSYLSKKKLINLNREEFRSILDKIDNNILTANMEGIISDALDSISDFYNDGGISRSSVQPVLAEAYLKDKGLNELVRRIQKEIKDNKKKSMIDELKKILFSEPVTEEINIESKSDIVTKEEKEIIDKKTRDLRDFEFQEEKPKKEDAAKEKNIPVEQSGFEEKKNEPEKKENATGKKDIIAEQTKSEVKQKEPEEREEVNEIKKMLVEKAEPEEKKNEPKPEIKSDVPEEKDLPTEQVESTEKIIEPEPETVDEKEKENGKTLIIDEEEAEVQDKIPEEEIIEEYPIGFKDADDIEELIEDEIEEVKNKDVLISKENKRVKDIFSFLNEKEIEKIVGEVFNDDEDDFANTMERLSECSTYDQASEILKSLFLTYRINPYTREAVTLTNAVSNYFHQDE